MELTQRGSKPPDTISAVQKNTRAADISLLALLAVTVSLLALASRLSLNNRRAASSRKSSQPIKTKFTLNDVLGRFPHIKGLASSPYTLVEFFDYQCPPCRGSYASVQSHLQKYQGKLRLCVRNFPLPFHSMAAPSAKIAEAAGEQGRFWPVHDALMIAPTLTPETLEQAERQLDRNKLKVSLAVSAPRVVQQDTDDAKCLGIDGTPTFFLCLPDHTVWKLNSPDDIDQLVH